MKFNAMEHELLYVGTKPAPMSTWRARLLPIELVVYTIFPPLRRTTQHSCNLCLVCFKPMAPLHCRGTT